MGFAEGVLGSCEEKEKVAEAVRAEAALRVRKGGERDVECLCCMSDEALRQVNQRL